MRSGKSWMPLLLALFFPFSSSPAADKATPRSADEQIIRVTAKKFEFTPNEIKLRRNVPVILELTSADRIHGFKVPDLNLQAEVKPGEVSRVRFIPEKVGTFAFHCDRFCGSGHEEMTGQIVVTD